MVPKQTEITIYKTVDKNTEDKNTKNTHVTRRTLKTCDVQSSCRYSPTDLKMYESVIQFQHQYYANLSNHR